MYEQVTYLTCIKADTLINEQGAINNTIGAHKHCQFHGRGLGKSCPCDGVAFGNQNEQEDKH